MLGFGGLLRIGERLALEIAVIEDDSVRHAVPDIGLHTALRWRIQDRRADRRSAGAAGAARKADARPPLPWFAGFEMLHAIASSPGLRDARAES